MPDTAINGSPAFFHAASCWYCEGQRKCRTRALHAHRRINAVGRNSFEPFCMLICFYCEMSTEYTTSSIEIEMYFSLKISNILNTDHIGSLCIIIDFLCYKILLQCQTPQTEEPLKVRSLIRVRKRLIL